MIKRDATKKNIYIYLCIFFHKLRLYELLLLLLGQRSIPYGYDDTKILFASVEKKGKKDYPHNQGYREIIWRER